MDKARTSDPACSDGCEPAPLRHVAGPVVIAARDTLKERFEKARTTRYYGQGRANARSPGGQRVPGLYCGQSTAGKVILFAMPSPCALPCRAPLMPSSKHPSSYSAKMNPTPFPGAWELEPPPERKSFALSVSFPNRYILPYNSGE